MYSNYIGDIGGVIKVESVWWQREKDSEPSENYCKCDSLSRLKGLAKEVRTLENKCDTLSWFSEFKSTDGKTQINPDNVDTFILEEDRLDNMYRLLDAESMSLQEREKIRYDEEGQAYCNSCDLPLKEMEGFEG